MFKWDSMYQNLQNNKITHKYQLFMTLCITLMGMINSNQKQNEVFLKKILNYKSLPAFITLSPHNIHFYFF